MIGAPEAGGDRAEGRGRSAGSGGVEAHGLRLESEVRRDGGERRAGSETVARRQHAAAEAGGEPESGQGSLAVGDLKKQIVALKAAVEQVREEYPFSQRRACGLMTIAVSSYRYQTRRSDEPLRTRLEFGFDAGVQNRPPFSPLRHLPGYAFKVRCLRTMHAADQVFQYAGIIQRLIYAQSQVSGNSQIYPPAPSNHSTGEQTS